jgi:two-component system sensor histidine kinase QseC
VKRAPSLRSRLLGGVLAAVALAWLAVAALGYAQSRRELAALFDSHLAQSASLLIAQVTGELDEDEAEHAPRVGGETRDVAFQIWRRGERLGVHSRSAPNERLSDEASGFSTNRVDGVDWRVYSATTRRSRTLVQVGERESARDAVSREIASHLLLPLAVALPLLGGALALVIGRALRPLRALAHDIAARDPQRLEPVALEGAPREVAPVVERLNALFARFAASLERERAFTADAAHELRTPLAAIRAQAQVARDATSEADRAQALARVIAGCDRASRLAEQLLALARVDASDASARFGAHDLVAVARDALAELAPQALARGVAIELDAPASVRVRGDGTLLALVVRNLADNAARYSPRGRTVRVRIARESGSAILEVADDGPGIPAAERARLFDRFARGESAGEPGAGLGLSIVARVAALHGGSASLHDGPRGRGTLARVVIPALA